MRSCRIECMDRGRLLRKLQICLRYVILWLPPLLFPCAFLNVSGIDSRTIGMKTCCLWNHQARRSPMDFGLHLPLIDFGGNPFTLKHLIAYAEAGRDLGFNALAANDHMVFSKPWLDGPTALAAVLSNSGRMDLATTVSLPIIRGPAALAKTLSAIDRLSDGRLIACVGPGSSARDYALVGLPFEERWKRLEEAVQALRAFWSRDGAVFKGNFYNTEGIRLEPFPAQKPSP